MGIANAIGLTVATLLLLLLAGKPKKHNYDYALIILVVAIAGFFLAHIWVGYDLTPGSYVFLELSTAALFTPLVIYALLLIAPEHTFRPVWLWFGLPDAVFVVYIILDLFVGDRLATMTIDEVYRNPPFYYFLYHKLQKVYVVAVLIWLLRQIRRYQKQIREVYSSTEDVQLDWMKVFLYMHLVTVILGQIFFIPYNLGYIASIELPFAITSSVFALIMFYMIYHGIKQQVLAIFPHVPEPKHDPPEQTEHSSSNTSKDDNAVGKYQTSSLSETAMTHLFGELTRLFEQDALYLVPDLKVQDVAAKLTVTSHNVSQVLNVKAGKSFYDFVNGYRVAHMQRLLAAPETQHFTILALANESGFNSKATMNRVFKQHTDMTPRQYRQRQATMA